MRNIISCLVIAAVVCLCPGISFGGEFFVGKVIEHTQNRELIQVRDTIYKVNGNVFLDDGISPVVSVLRTSINEGSYVQVYPTFKTDDYWETDKVVVLMGVKKNEILVEFGSKYDPRAERLLKYEREEQDH